MAITVRFEFGFYDCRSKQIVTNLNSNFLSKAIESIEIIIDSITDWEDTEATVTIQSSERQIVVVFSDIISSNKRETVLSAFVNFDHYNINFRVNATQNLTFFLKQI